MTKKERTERIYDSVIRAIVSLLVSGEEVVYAPSTTSDDGYEKVKNLAQKIYLSPYTPSDGGVIEKEAWGEIYPILGSEIGYMGGLVDLNIAIELVLEEIIYSGFIDGLVVDTNEFTESRVSDFAAAPSTMELEIEIILPVRLDRTDINYQDWNKLVKDISSGNPSKEVLIEIITKELEGRGGNIRNEIREDYEVGLMRYSFNGNPPIRD